jgi:hypothetical protein
MLCFLVFSSEHRPVVVIDLRYKQDPEVVGKPRNEFASDCYKQSGFPLPVLSDERIVYALRRRWLPEVAVD